MEENREKKKNKEWSIWSCFCKCRKKKSFRPSIEDSSEKSESLLQEDMDLESKITPFEESKTHNASHRPTNSSKSPKRTTLKEETSKEENETPEVQAPKRADPVGREEGADGVGNCGMGSERNGDTERKEMMEEVVEEVIEEIRSEVIDKEIKDVCESVKDALVKEIDDFGSCLREKYESVQKSQEMGISENLIQTYKNKNCVATVLLCFDLNNEDWRIKADSKLNLSDPNIYSILFTTPSPIPKLFTKILTHLSLAISTKPLINSPQTQDEEEGRDESQLVKPYQITFENFDFSEKMGCLCEVLQICIDEEIIRVAFEQCVFPYVTEKGVSQLIFITPQEQMRPFYGISFTECEFIQNLEEEKNYEYDKADQIGLLLNCPGLPSPLRDPNVELQIEGGISSISFKNNKFTDIEMAKLKVYLCYAENLLIFEEDKKEKEGEEGEDEEVEEDEEIEEENKKAAKEESKE
ncbi:unnamed protein product [Moneuplotes crassus]|uniref:Uncharacterized protein n=1 Tax=Euplotes crassus TaxID=5936 RepID=A0AAD1YAB9_EUPCR|nr:unnamed protein product [Moneuplotes crassus]